MIVCHCRVVSDRDIDAAIDAGAVGICRLSEICGAGQRCGGCLPAVRRLMERRGLPCEPVSDARELRRLLGLTRPVREPHPGLATT